jgi:enoyl-CoA hydratase/carnithine racemase
MSDATAHEPSPIETPVLFEERETQDGHRIGIATLNAPKTLNGLSLPMAERLDAQLRAWADDAGVVVVVLQGTGEKAFCAGGDLHGLYRSMVQKDAYADAFFEREYRLDYRIHTYAKPILCWGHGVVMGGGIGLMAGASHRVVTERSRVAFPEITIGLYPDVGGSYLLNRVPGRGGRFLGLTGAPLDASDAIYAGLADVRLASESRPALDNALLATAWSADAGQHAAQLTGILHALATDSEAGPLERHRAVIDAACDGDDLEAIVTGINAMAQDDPWIATAVKTLGAGAPGSARLAFDAQARANGMSLADVFRMEYVMSSRCVASGSFAEGIRALLIDKDRNPHWHPATLRDATVAWAEPFFTASFPPSEHPLRDLDAAALPSGRQ